MLYVDFFWVNWKKSLVFFFSSENCWCPKIYYNHKCFSGPYLSKGRIASLPKCVGPGPVGLVMKEVLTNLINVAYKSFRVLKELQLEGKPNPKMQQQTIKAKYVIAVNYCGIFFIHGGSMFVGSKKNFLVCGDVILLVV